MKTIYTYAPSRLMSGEAALLRERSFTRWMSRDLLQPASDFLKNLHLLAIYAETSPDDNSRYILWHPPEGCGFEVRSGRTEDEFEEIDRANIMRDWALLSLHVNECDIHSAVWVSASHVETARKVLAGYGITPARRILFS